MNGPAKRALARQYRHKIEKATDDALKGATPEELKDDLQQIENYGKLVALNDKHRSTADAKWAAVVAFVCLAVASLLWSCKVQRNSISLIADTETLQGELKSDWQLDNPFRCQSLHLERVSRLEAPNLGVSLDNPQGDVWLRLDGGKVSVQSLELDGGALVSLASDPEEVSIFVSRRPMRGKITVVGTGTITAGIEPQQTSVHSAYELDIPETLEFVVSDPGAVPSRLSLHALQKCSLGKAPFANLNFALEESRDVTESNFTSGIKSGSLTFNDTGWPAQPVSERDILALHDTGQSVFEVSSNGPLIHVALNGVVGGVTLGQGDARRELAPSYLEYLYNKKKFGFFWGSVVGIWGVIWGICKTIF